MGIDFNDAPEQGSGAGPIAEDSVVMVTAQIRPPKAGKEGGVHPLFCVASSGYEYLDLELTAVNGRKIWANYMLHYSKAPTEKSAQAISISMRTLRAIVESTRKINPKDTSPTATSARIISDFSDLNGMMFPILVGIEWSQPNASGKRFLNNTLKRVVTPDDPRYEQVWSTDQGLILSDKPLPPEPEAGAAAGGPKPAWVKGDPEPAKTEPAKSEAAQGTIPGVKQATKPAWVK
jgi:hypothetical protein